METSGKKSHYLIVNGLFDLAILIGGLVPIAEDESYFFYAICILGALLFLTGLILLVFWSIKGSLSIMSFASPDVRDIFQNMAVILVFSLVQLGAGSARLGYFGLGLSLLNLVIGCVEWAKQKKPTLS